ncbi:MAG TPA: hypothetical protein VGF77_07620 [Allosphingosinicella sp.]
MLLAQDSPPDCRRVRSDPELEACEIERTPHDVLNSANRPIARQLGTDAIRFSTQPSLGGRAFIVEAVKSEDGGAHVQAFWLEGHPYEGWNWEGSTALILSTAAYDRLAALVDRLLGTELSPRTPESERLICMDGPEALTERVRDGKVITLSGSCPLNEHELHPNAHIEAAMLSLICAAVMRSAPKDTLLRRNCKRWQKIAGRDYPIGRNDHRGLRRRHVATG